MTKLLFAVALFTSGNVFACPEDNPVEQVVFRGDSTTDGFFYRCGDAYDSAVLIANKACYRWNRPENCGAPVVVAEETRIGNLVGHWQCTVVVTVTGKRGPVVKN